MAVLENRVGSEVVLSTNIGDSDSLIYEWVFDNGVVENGVSVSRNWG